MATDEINWDWHSWGKKLFSLQALTSVDHPGCDWHMLLAFCHQNKTLISLTGQMPS